MAASADRGHGETGASAVEYGLIVFAIAAVIAAVAFAFGGTVYNLFDGSCKTIASKTDQAANCSP